LDDRGDEIRTTLLAPTGMELAPPRRFSNQTTVGARRIPHRAAANSDEQRQAGVKAASKAALIGMKSHRRGENFAAEGAECVARLRPAIGDHNVAPNWGQPFDLKCLVVTAHRARVALWNAFFQKGPASIAAESI
jgi:hypothetical protein